MKLIKTVLGISLLVTAPTLWAQPEDTSGQNQGTQKPIAAYGDNPNIFHVWAYKAQEGVIGAAKNAGALTEKGVAKVKPSVDQAWNNSKELASSTVQQVDQSAQHATQQVNAKIQETREVMGGKPQQSAPIIQGSLSDESPAQIQQSSPSVQHAPARPTATQTPVPPEPEEEIKVTRL